MPTKKKFTQGEFDVKKWLDSESSGSDKCGSYEFCGYCDKKGEAPCEAAQAKYLAAKKEATKPATKKTTKRVSTKATTKKASK